MIKKDYIELYRPVLKLVFSVAVSVTAIALSVTGPAHSKSPIDAIIMDGRGNFDEYMIVTPKNVVVVYAGNTKLVDKEGFPIKNRFGDFINVKPIRDSKLLTEKSKNEITREDQILIRIYNAEALQRHRELNAITTLPVGNGHTDLGKPIPYASDTFEERVNEGNRKVEKLGSEKSFQYRYDIFREQIFPTVCKSHYSSNAPISKNTPSKRYTSKWAVFFVEDSDDARSCIERLFLDFLGLRGIAISDEGLTKPDFKFIEQILEFETGTIIPKD